MEKEYKPSDVIEWDVRNWSAALEYWEQESKIDLSGCLALELGAKNGGLSLWMALRGARVICSDLHGPIEQARLLHDKYKVSHLIEYESVDATRIPYSDHFDVVLLKSVLGGIGWNDNKDKQRQTVQEIHKCLKPGGEFMFAENLTASPFHRFFRRRFVKWGREWRYISIGEMREFLMPFSRVRYITRGFLGVSGRTETQRNVLSAIDRMLFDYLVPENWRYIIIGVAGK